MSLKLKSKKTELRKKRSKPKVTKIENIARPMSSYTQSLKPNKPKNAISHPESQLSLRGIMDEDDDLIIPTE
uniref:Uncharacterized protein n=1 Tax=Romanomermis culicivorax TaxID=13658 RepID=A0A915K599_ROMCU